MECRDDPGHAAGRHAALNRASAFDALHRKWRDTLGSGVGADWNGVYPRCDDHTSHSACERRVHVAAVCIRSMVDDSEWPGAHRQRNNSRIEVVDGGIGPSGSRHRYRAQPARAAAANCECVARRCLHIGRSRGDRPARSHLDQLRPDPPRQRYGASSRALVASQSPWSCRGARRSASDPGRDEIQIQGPRAFADPRYRCGRVGVAFGTGGLCARDRTDTRMDWPCAAAGASSDACSRARPWRTRVDPADSRGKSG